MTGPVARGAADLHTHTSLTDGMMDVQALLTRAQAHTDLDVLAITDHDDITAGLLARDLAERNGYRFQVIVGMEITTLGGHLIGLFLEDPIPRFQSVAATLKAIHRQGGLAIAPHPMSWLTFSLGQRALLRVAEAQDAGVYFDGLETANPSLAAQVTRAKARHLNSQRLHLAEIGASDAHFLPAVGSGFTRFSGTTAEDLRHAILAKSTDAVATAVPLRSIGYSQLVKQQVRSLLVRPAQAASRPLVRFLHGGSP